MTSEEINATIERELGGPRYGLKKRGLWYRQNAHGYTDRADEAWRLTELEAKQYEHVDSVPSERVLIAELPPRNFYADLNACAEFTNFLCKSSIEMEAFVDNMRSVVALKSYGSDLRLFYLVNATAPQRCEAFLRLCGKWKGTP